MTACPRTLSRSFLEMTKHHGLGNDFLILVDLEARVPEAERAALARAVCDRHRGIGADGLLFALPASCGSASVSMRLHNADGGIAEISGNGIRCFAQAMVLAGLASPGDLDIVTDAGPRTVVVGETGGDGVADVRVDMGTAVLNPPALRDGDGPPVGAVVPLATMTATVDMGNPHLVVGIDEGIDDLSKVDITRDGPRLEMPYLDGPSRGINVEIVQRRVPVLAGATPAGVDMVGVDMVVWERGVGATQACGSGACATAVAARSWGWCGDRVAVHQPGGSAVVELCGDRITLIGPTQYIATVQWPVPTSSAGR